MRKLAIVPAPEAATLHDPAIVVTPPELVRNVDGKVIVASKPVGSDAAQFTGSAPENSFSTPDVLTVVWICPTRLFRNVALNRNATNQFPSVDFVTACEKNEHVTVTPAGMLTVGRMITASRVPTETSITGLRSAL